MDGVVVAADKPGAPVSSTGGGPNMGIGRNFDAAVFWSGPIDGVRVCNRAVRANGG